MQNKTFSNTTNFTPTSNQMLFGGNLTLNVDSSSANTITLPNATDSIVLEAETQTLTNKILTTPIVNQIQFGSGTTYTNLVATNHSGDGINTWTLLDATDTIVGEAFPQTLSNKTITKPLFTGATNQLYF